MSAKQKWPVPPLCECGKRPRVGDKKGIYYKCRNCGRSYNLIDGQLVEIPKREKRNRSISKGEFIKTTADEYEESVS